MQRTTLVLSSSISPMLLMGPAKAVPIDPGVLTSLTAGSDHTS